MKKLLLIFLAGCIFLVGYISAAGLTLDKCITNIRVLTNDQLITGITPRQSSNTITDLINQVIYETVDLVWCLTFETRTTLSPHTSYYALPDDAFIPYRVVLGTVVLEQASFKQLDGEYPGWQVESAGVPEKYYIAVSSYTNAPVTIGFYPVSISTRVMILDYVVIPTELTSGTTVLFNGEKRLYPYHSLVTLRVASLLNDVRGFSALAQSLDDQYGSLLEAMANTIKIKPGDVPKRDLKSP